MHLSNELSLYQRLPTHLKTSHTIELRHHSAFGVFDDSNDAASVSVTLGIVARDVVIVDVVGEVKEKVVTARRLDCNRNEPLA